MNCKHCDVTKASFCKVSKLTKHIPTTVVGGIFGAEFKQFHNYFNLSMLRLQLVTPKTSMNA